MSKRVTGEYFSIYTSKNATGNQPTQDGKLLVNAEMLEAMTDIARSQQMNGEAIEVKIDMGFWVQTAKDSGQKYLRGRPAVYVSDEVEEKMAELNDLAGADISSAEEDSFAQGSLSDEIPF